MANPFYQPGKPRASKVNDLFGTIARRYDLVNDLQSLGLHRLWKREVVRLARLQPHETALDVCAGTGDLAFRLANNGALTVGLDFNAAMLELALERRGNPGPRSSPWLVQGDALRLPFSTATFDVVTVGYGLRNLSDARAGLEEMLRVLRPGGRFLALDFGKPGNPLWRAICYTYLRCGVPFCGRILCGNADAYAYILESLKAYPAQQGVAAILRDLGALKVGVRNFLGGAMSINYAEKP